MTQFPSPKSPDFDRLRTFLQENAPQAPEPASDLEAELMAAINLESGLEPELEVGLEPQERPRRPLRPSKRCWILSAAIVTGLGLLWGSGRVWQMAQHADPSSSDTELLALQAFLEDTWGVVGYVDTTETWTSTTWLALNRTNVP